MYAHNVLNRELTENTRVVLGAVQFFLGRDKKEQEESESEDEGPDLKQLQHAHEVGKKKKSKERQLAAAKALLKKVIRPTFLY